MPVLKPSQRPQLRRLLLLGVVLTAPLFHAVAHAACNSVGPVLPPAVANPAGAQSADDQPADDQRSVIGLWHVCLYAGATVFDEGFDMFSAGGTEVLNDTIPPPLPPYSAGFICLGAFRSTGPGTYRLRHPFWTADQTGTLIGTGVFLEEITVDRGGNTYGGTFEAITYDLSGNTTSDTTGTLHAERVIP
jgi:hypothetical protein